MLLDQANNRSNDTALPYTLNEKEKKCLLANQLHATCNDSWPRSPSSWLLESVKHVAHTTSSSIDMWAEGTLNHLMSRVHQEEAYKHTEHNTIMSSIKPIFLEKGAGEKKRERNKESFAAVSHSSSMQSDEPLKMFGLSPPRKSSLHTTAAAILQQAL